MWCSAYKCCECYSEQPIPRELAFYGAGTGKILLDNLACLGTESSIFSCRPYTVGTHNCGHGEDAGVNCQPCKSSLLLIARLY